MAFRFRVVRGRERHRKEKGSETLEKKSEGKQRIREKEYSLVEMILTNC